VYVQDPDTGEVVRLARRYAFRPSQAAVPGLGSSPASPTPGFTSSGGRSGRVAVGASSRIYWERAMVWPAPTSRAFPYLLAIAP
jgi:hypothetical protein